jgi:hypothetical protein
VGPEFGALQGQRVLIVRALYGLKSSGAAWHDHFSNTLFDMSFKPSYADGNVWMRPAIKPHGCKHCEYILVYVDDLLIISHQTNNIVDVIKQSCCLKDDDISPPKTYLGAWVQKSHLPNNTSKTQWSISADQYIKNVLSNIKMKLSKDGITLNSKKYASTPFSSGYRPELDITPL